MKRIGTGKQLEALAGKLMRAYNLKGWKFKIEPLVSRLGECCKGRREIVVSSYHLKGSDYAGVLDTLLHEIAHALDPTDEIHGKTWKALAEKVGATPERCSKNGPSAEVYRSKYFLVCDRCGAKWARHRNRGSWFVCASMKCKGENRSMKLVENPEYVRVVKWFIVEDPDNGFLVKPAGYVEDPTTGKLVYDYSHYPYRDNKQTWSDNEEDAFRFRSRSKARYQACYNNTNGRRVLERTKKVKGSSQ